MKTRLTREERFSMLANKPRESKAWIVKTLWPSINWNEYGITCSDVVSVCKQRGKLKKLDGDIVTIAKPGEEIDTVARWTLKDIQKGLRLFNGFPKKDDARVLAQRGITFKQWREVLAAAIALANGK